LAHERTFFYLGYPRTPTISSNLRPPQHVNRTALSDADFKARAKADRNNYLSRIADEVEEDLQHNNMR